MEMQACFQVIEGNHTHLLNINRFENIYDIRAMVTEEKRKLREVSIIPGGKCRFVFF